MTSIVLVGEDELSCALGARLVEELLPNWKLSGVVNTRGITKLLPGLGRYIQQARHVQPVLCVADTDGQCPVDFLRACLLPEFPPGFLFRLADSEAESWLLADRQGFAEFLKVPLKDVPQPPMQVPDAKRKVLELARKSKVRLMRDEIVSALDINKPGNGYNLHLTAFVRETWDYRRAAAFSPSLARAVQRIASWRQPA